MILFSKKVSPFFSVTVDRYIRTEGDDSKPALEKEKRWKEGVSKDPVINEAMNILGDMLKAKR